MEKYLMYAEDKKALNSLQLYGTTNLNLYLPQARKKML
jgi:hypothetical protein